MGRKKRPMVYLKVITERVYFFEEGSINGWPADEVIDDWFNVCDIEDTHATRDTYRIGNTSVVTSVQVISEGELEEHIDKRSGYVRELVKRRADRRAAFLASLAVPLEEVHNEG